MRTGRHHTKQESHQQDSFKHSSFPHRTSPTNISKHLITRHTFVILSRKSLRLCLKARHTCVVPSSSLRHFFAMSYLRRTFAILSQKALQLCLIIPSPYRRHTFVIPSCILSLKPHFLSIQLLLVLVIIFIMPSIPSAYLRHTFVILSRISLQL